MNAAETDLKCYIKRNADLSWCVNLKPILTVRVKVSLHSLNSVNFCKVPYLIKPRTCCALRVWKLGSWSAILHEDCVFQSVIPRPSPSLLSYWRAGTKGELAFSSLRPNSPDDSSHFTLLQITTHRIVV